MRREHRRRGEVPDGYHRQAPVPGPASPSARSFLPGSVELVAELVAGETGTNPAQGLHRGLGPGEGRGRRPGTTFGSRVLAAAPALQVQR